MTRDHHPGQLRVVIAEDSVLLLYPGDMGHRRVLAVLRYLGDGPQSAAPKSLCHDRAS